MTPRYMSIYEWKRKLQEMRQLLDVVENNPPEFIKEAACPDCGTTEIAKNGKNSKGNCQYRCLNKDCSRKSFVI